MLVNVRYDTDLVQWSYVISNNGMYRSEDYVNTLLVIDGLIFSVSNGGVTTLTKVMTYLGLVTKYYVVLHGEIRLTF